MYPKLLIVNCQTLFFPHKKLYVLTVHAILWYFRLKVFFSVIWCTIYCNCKNLLTFQPHFLVITMYFTDIFEPYLFSERDVASFFQSRVQYHVRPTTRHDTDGWHQAHEGQSETERWRRHLLGLFQVAGDDFELFSGFLLLAPFLSGVWVWYLYSFLVLFEIKSFSLGKVLRLRVWNSTRLPIDFVIFSIS